MTDENIKGHYDNLRPLPGKYKLGLLDEGSTKYRRQMPAVI